MTAAGDPGRTCALQRPRTSLITALLAVALATALLVVLADSATAHHGPPYPTGEDHAFGEVVDYPLVFPVDPDGMTSDLWDTFTAYRCCDPDEIHHAQDLMAKKMTEVYAAAPGRIRSINWSRKASEPGDDRCCSMVIVHDDGWQTWYLHLNNDTPGTDDGQGWGIAPGLRPGSRVEAGQLIGWVGDSAAAENTPPHLHFELLTPERIIVNPIESLLNAPIVVPDPRPGPCPEGEKCDVVTLLDGLGRWRMRTGLGDLNGWEAFTYGNPGDIPFSGDWDCDGTRTPGLYRQSDGYVYLRNGNDTGIADIQFFFGDPGDVPVPGDFDGDGCDTLSIYRPSTATFHIVNQLGSDDTGLGAADHSFVFGNVGDTPFSGDFDGDGVTEVGLHRASSGFVYFRNTLDTGIADLQFFYGDPGDVILAGDWDGDGDDTVAVFRPSNGTLYVNLENAPGVADYELEIGPFASAVVAR